MDGAPRCTGVRLFMKHFDAVIFDLDGTLLDTERVAQEAFLITCDELAVTRRLDLLQRCVGAADSMARAVIQDGYGPELDGAAFFAAWSRNFNAANRTTPVALKEGALALLDAVAQLGLPMAIATSSATPHALEIAAAGRGAVTLPGGDWRRSGAQAEARPGRVSAGRALPGRRAHGVPRRGGLRVRPCAPPMRPA